MSEGGKRVMEVEDFAALKGCPWPDFWQGQGNIDATEAVKCALAGGTGRFRGPANTAKGTPRYWDVQVGPIFGDDGKPTHLLSISRDITEEWKAAERQEFLTRELQHRVKNTLANVISIANQTFRGETYREVRTAFNARLITLDRAHDALTKSNWGKTDIHQIIDAALQPHGIQASSLRIDGPEIQFAPKQALALALAINELATNAMKYGSLRDMGRAHLGRVDVTWSVKDNVFEWQWLESGGPAVAAPARTGFGTRVIKELLAAEMNAASDIAYDESGLVCTVRVNADALVS